MRVVLDTNVIISALVFGGKPRSILQRIMRAEVDLTPSEPIVEELTGVLRRPKFGFPPEVIRATVGELTSLGDMVKPVGSIDEIPEDAADNRILECAAAGHADYIVTGDHHLLQLRQFKDTKIVTASQFLALLEERT